jgi:hypothetical protein
MLVLTNACDHVRGADVICAPVRPLKLKSDPKVEPQKAWVELSNRATGGSTPREFYLPPNGVELADHHVAYFDEMVSFTPAFLKADLERGAARVLGLNEDGVTHLRWALSFFFGRNARDDFAWQTSAVLELRLAALKASANGNPKIDEEIKLVQAELEKRTSTAAQVESTSRSSGT